MVRLYSPLSLSPREYEIVCEYWVIRAFFGENQVEGDIFGVHRTFCGRSLREAVAVTGLLPSPVSDTEGKSSPLLISLILKVLSLHDCHESVPH